ncbi:MAG: hypothetical protein GY805_17380, partial [Chloroflexi bacterium]|nr:hypothetical protein [Chloroflexota bacterium]
MNNQQLINEGLPLLEQIRASQPIALGKTAVSHQLHHTPQLSATLIAQRQSGSEIEHANLVKLFQKADRHFNDSELRDLCFQLNVEYKDLAGLSKRDKMRELVTLIDRNGRLPDFTTLATQLRPNVKWQDPPQRAGETEIVAKLNIAVVVDIARPTIRDVARYLDEAEMDVNFLLLQNAQPDNFLSPDNKWDDFIIAFAQTMDNIKHSFSGARLHFFLA